MNSTKILDGKSVAAAVLDECRAETAALLAKGIQPGLAVVLVGILPTTAAATDGAATAPKTL